MLQTTPRFLNDETFPLEIDKNPNLFGTDNIRTIDRDNIVQIPKSNGKWRKIQDERVVII